MSNQQLKSFKKYVETREAPEGVTTFEGHVFVPKELLEAIDIEEDIFKFRDLVTVAPVTRPKGTQPIFNLTNETLDPVEELVLNPKLPINPFTPVDYKTKTYRGYVLVSQEIVDDGQEITNAVDKILHRTVTNTENKSIFNTLKAIANTPATKTDELRDLLTTFTNTKKIKVYVTQEAYNIFDKAGLIKQSSKYEDGTVLGKELVSIEGEGNVTFIGNLKELVFFDRSINTVRYEQYLHYGQALNVAARHDVKLLEGSKIKKVTFTPA